ncbi:MAG TPA: hypothetical protein VGO59_05335 [Verrucomicrobiae bacterium]
MIVIQALARVGKTVVRQSPNPHGAIGDDQGSRRLPQTASQRFGVQLLAQAIDAFARGHKAALADDGPSALGLPAMIKPEAGAGVNPMPLLRLLSAPAQLLRLAPTVPLADVPSVDLDNHLIGFQHPFRRQTGSNRPGLLIELAAQALGALALAFGFPMHRGARHFTPVRCSST